MPDRKESKRCKKEYNAVQPENRKRRSRLQRRAAAVLIALCLTAAFLFAPFTAGIRSLLITSVYDLACEQQSLPRKLGITLDMPLKNMDFYPLMLTYNDDDGMSSWLNKPVRFTVDYAVASFKFFSSHSSFYDMQSPLYNAYTGAYYLQGFKNPAGRETVLDIASFDQRCLALPAIGLSTGQAVFQAEDIRQSSEPAEIAGYDWQRYDANITTNGPEHTKKDFYSGYILFGDPPPAAVEYPLCKMAGRIYTTYLSDCDLTIGLYILAKDENILEEIDRKIVSGTIIKRSVSK